MSAEWNWSYPYPLPGGTDLAQRLSQTEQSVERLSKRLEQVERQLEELKNKTPVHIEYHFDQLKVNELKGTLNVGLSPQGEQGIDSFETPLTTWPQAGTTAAGTDDRPIHELTQQMETYMETDAPAILSGLEQQYGITLEPSHRLRLLADVKGQLRDRVHYYARVTAYPSEGTVQERQLWRQSVIDRTVRDIQAALTAYVDNWRRKPNRNQGGITS